MEAMKETIDQSRLTLAGGAAALALRGQLLIGAALSIGSCVLGYENINEAAADWLLEFKTEKLELRNVSLRIYIYFFQFSLNFNFNRLFNMLTSRMMHKHFWNNY